jgi:predicted secreted Zn-dependent protease
VNVSALFAASWLCSTGCVVDASGPARITQWTPAPNVHATRRLFTYAVSGANGGEVRAQLNRVGPLDGGDRRTDASTSMYMRWGYDLDRADDCGLTAPHVEVQVTVVMPVWTDVNTASRGDRAEWSRYIGVLASHEAIHERIDVDAAAELAAALARLPRRPTCDEVDASVAQAKNAAFQRMDARNLEYDRATGHGATQGAVFY